MELNTTKEEKEDPLLSAVCDKIDSKRRLEEKHRRKRKAWNRQLADASSSGPDLFNRTAADFFNDLRPKTKQQTNRSSNKSLKKEEIKNNIPISSDSFFEPDNVCMDSVTSEEDGRSEVNERSSTSSTNSPGGSAHSPLLPISPTVLKLFAIAADDVQDSTNYSEDKIHSEDIIESVCFKLDPVINYIYELTQRGGISPVSNDYSAFCLSKFDEKQGKLKSYVFVIRKPIMFEDNWDWLYACTCNRGDTKYLALLSQHIPLSRTDFGLGYREDCIHIKAALQLMTKFDARNDIDPESHYKDKERSCDECPVYSLLGADDVVAVFDGQRDEFGAITLVRNHMSCLVCTNSTACAHIHILKSLEGSSSLPVSAAKILQISGGGVDADLDSEAGQEKCLSWRAIPFTNERLADKELKIMDSTRSDAALVLLPIKYEKFALCNLCDSLRSTENCVENGWLFAENVKVYMDVGIRNAKVYYIKCSNENCENKQYYDGLEDGLINMGQYLVSHKLLRRFMLSFLHGRMPIYVFHLIYVREKCDDGFSDLVGSFTYNKFKDAWYCYRSLLDIDIDTGFDCDICLDKPSVLIMDATSLSFRREFSNWRSFLQTVDENSEDKIPRYSHFRERIMVSLKRCRNLLLRYSCSGRRKKSRLDREEYDEMLDLLQQESPEIFRLVKDISDSSTFEDHQYTRQEKQQPTASAAFSCPLIWIPFIEALGCSTPVCGIIHQDAELLLALEQFIESGSATGLHLEVFKRSFPVLHDIIVSFDNFSCPRSLFPVLRRMLDISKEPFNCTSFDIDKLCLALDESEEISQYSHWPKLKQVRERGFYEMDTKRASRASRSCHKMSTGHPTLLPGVFTMFCQHEICYGFEVMLTEESPDVPFSVIFKRFQQAPDIIVYDNACSLHEYCLNRQPKFFERTRFLVDRLHWKNHTGCSEGYNLDKYVSLKDLNTQINEQMNSCLKRIKPSLSYMTHVNFMRHCCLFLWYRNLLTKERRLQSLRK